MLTRLGSSAAPRFQHAAFVATPMLQGSSGSEGGSSGGGGGSRAARLSPSLSAHMLSHPRRRMSAAEAEQQRKREHDAKSWLSLDRWRRHSVEYGLFDWLLVILIGLLTLLIDQLEPYHKPLSELQLADPNINLSFEPSIVPNSVLVFVAIALPAILIAALFPFRRRQAGATVEVRLAMLAFCMCILLNLLATAFGKKYIGRPRPNFVSYTGYFNGTYALEHNKRDAFQSFPSGHSSTSFAGLGFLTFYMTYNLYYKWRLGSTEGGGLFSPVDGVLVSNSEVYRRRKAKEHIYGVHNNQLPFLLFLTGPLWIALFISFSRVRDHHHNYDDILAGMCLGLSIAYATYRTIYLGRRSEWLAVNEAAFRLELELEAEEAEAQADATKRTGTDVEMGAATSTAGGDRGGAAASAGIRRLDINERGVSRHLVEAELRRHPDLGFPAQPSFEEERRRDPDVERGELLVESLRHSGDVEAKQQQHYASHSYEMGV